MEQNVVPGTLQGFCRCCISARRLPGPLGARPEFIVGKKGGNDHSGSWIRRIVSGGFSDLPHDLPVPCPAGAAKRGPAKLGRGTAQARTGRKGRGLAGKPADASEISKPRCRPYGRQGRGGGCGVDTLVAMLAAAGIGIDIRVRMTRPKTSNLPALQDAPKAGRRRVAALEI